LEKKSKKKKKKPIKIDGLKEVIKLKLRINP